jgi:hypothetical protein
VLHELLECHAWLPDAVFDQRLRQPVGQPLLISLVWRLPGVVMAGGGRSADATR